MPTNSTDSQWPRGADGCCKRRFSLARRAGVTERQRISAQAGEWRRRMMHTGSSWSRNRPYRFLRCTRVYTLPWSFGPTTACQPIARNRAESRPLFGSYFVPTVREKFAQATPDQARFERARDQGGEGYLKPDLQADLATGFDRWVQTVLLEKWGRRLWTLPRFVCAASKAVN